MIRRIQYYATAAATAAWTVLLAFTAVADSATVSYQGILRDAALAPVADSTYEMTFSLWDAPSGGTKQWGDETHPAVSVVGGVFSVYLGSIEAFGTEFSDFSELWLEITADTGTGPETYAPRVPLASVPYAQQAHRADHAATAGDADTLQGLPASAFAEQNHAHDGADITTGTINTDRLNVGTGANQVAAGNHNHAMNDLANVSAGSPGDGHQLAWNQNAGQWESAGGFAVLRDVKPAGTSGGTAPSGWSTRTLNNIKPSSNLTGLTLSGNDFTLEPGRYRITVSAPAYRVNRHKAALLNVGTDTFEFIGTSEYSGAGSGHVQSSSIVRGRLNLTSSTTFRVRHFMQSAHGTHGYGVETGGATGVQEVYTTVEIERY